MGYKTSPKARERASTYTNEDLFDRHNMTCGRYVLEFYVVAKNENQYSFKKNWREIADLKKEIEEFLTFYLNGSNHFLVISDFKNVYLLIIFVYLDVFAKSGDKLSVEESSKNRLFASLSDILDKKSVYLLSKT